MRIAIQANMDFLLAGLIIAVLIMSGVLLVRFILKKSGRAATPVVSATLLFGFFLVWYLVTLGFVTGLWDPFSWSYVGESPTLRYNLIPFAAVPLAQQLQNLALFLPFGILLPLTFPKRPWKLPRAAAVSLALSLFIELAQLAMRIPWRTFDVNDLMMNVCGGLLGYGLLAVLQRALSTLNKRVPTKEVS